MSAPAAALPLRGVLRLLALSVDPYRGSMDASVEFNVTLGDLPYSFRLAGEQRDLVEVHGRQIRVEVTGIPVPPNGAPAPVLVLCHQGEPVAQAQVALSPSNVVSHGSSPASLVSSPKTKPPALPATSKPPPVAPLNTTTTTTVLRTSGYKSASVGAAALHEFLTSDTVKHVALPSQTSFLVSLARLCEQEGGELGVVKTEYQVDSHSVCLYDIKCRAHFEDDVMERIAKEWPAKNPDLGPIGPLRRGICVGVINDSHLVLSVGNIKFFYADSDDVLLKHSGRLLLSEKANGEYTMATLVGGGRWIVVGSKNVRVCLPFDVDNPERTMEIFRALFSREERYSYAADMLALWLEALDPKRCPKHAPLLAEEMTRGTLVGEQVGVHAHIYSGYARPSIRLFGFLPSQSLTTAVGSNLNETLQRLRLSPEEPGPVSFVRLEEFTLPRDEQIAKARLDDIASGSMEEHGEGVVAYLQTADGEPLGMYKFKNEEYHLDRRLRTLFTAIASELARQGATFARLKNETERIQSEMDRARKQFARVDAIRAAERVELVPAIMAFLDKHQSTIYCADWHDNFVACLEACRSKRNEYMKLASQFVGLGDPCMDAWTSFMDAHSSLLSQIRLKTVDESVKEIVRAYMAARAKDRYNGLGIASGSGGGKTTLLRKVQTALQEQGVACEFLDRDAFALASPTARADVVHKAWIKALEDAIGAGKVVLVGNTFTGTFADKISEQVESLKLFLVAVKEHTTPVTSKRLVPTSLQRRKCQDMDVRLRAAAFDLVCLSRLVARKEPGADASTLNVTVGARVVLEKFFSSQPDEPMLKKRLDIGSAVLLELCTGVDFSDEVGNELAKALVALKNTVQTVEQAKAKERQKRGKHDAGEAIDAGTRTKASHAVTKTLALNEWPDGGAVLYAAIMPTPASAMAMHALALPEMSRTDAHITLMYKPSTEDTEAFARLFGPDYLRCRVSLTVSSVVTVTRESDGHRLQYCPATMDNEELREHLPKTLHVTLGSTDIDLLPYARSGQIMQALAAASSKATETGGALVVEVEGDRLNVDVATLPQPVCFEGVPGLAVRM